MNSKRTKEVLKKFGISEINCGVSTGTQWIETKGEITQSYSPIDGSLIAKVKNATLDDYEYIIKTAREAFLQWRDVPAPQRG